MFPWAYFSKSKGAVKLNTLLDLLGNIPTFIYNSDGKLHEVRTLDLIPIVPGAFYVIDREYLDFERLYPFEHGDVFFVIQAKSNLKCRRIYSHPVDRTTEVICDQSVLLTGYYQAKHYTEKLRPVKYYDAKTVKKLVFLTNNFSLTALTIAELYRCRWQVELFFKWIKQNLRIKNIYGTSENAVKTQIWIAGSVYVLVAVMKKTTKNRGQPLHNSTFLERYYF